MTFLVRRTANTTPGQVNSFLLGFLTGLAIGTALGWLTAPHRGDITRRKIKRKIGDVQDQADEVMEDLRN